MASGSVMSRLHRRSFNLCVSSQVFKAVQKQKAEQRKKMKQNLSSKNTETTLSQWNTIYR